MKDTYQYKKPGMSEKALFVFILAAWVVLPPITWAVWDIPIFERKADEYIDVPIYDSLKNPGFEEETAGRPAYWSQIGKPIYYTDPDKAYKGNGSVCVGSNHTYGQKVEAFPGIGVCVLAYTRGTIGGEIAVSSEWFDVDTDYRFTAYSFTVLPDENSVTVELSALRTEEWVQFDEVVLIDEFLNAPGLESAGSWDLHGTASIVKDASESIEGVAHLDLPPGSGASQKTAVSAGDKKYILSGFHKGSSVDVRFEWYGFEGNSLRKDSVTIPAREEWTPFSLDFVPPPDRGPTSRGTLVDEPVFAEMELSTTDGPAQLDGLHLGWVVAIPREFSPDGDGYRDAVEFTFAIDETSVYEVTVYSATGALVFGATEEAGRIGANTVVWDGRNSAGDTVVSGQYVIQSKAKTVSGYDRVFKTDVKVVPGRPIAPFTEDLDDFFPRGVWVNTGVFESPDAGYWDAIFEELAEEGFNTVLASDYRSDLPQNPVFEAARKHKLRLIFGPGGLRGLTYGKDIYADISPEITGRVFDDLWAAVDDRTSLIGYQILDEPSRSLLPVIDVYSRTLADLSPETPSLTVLAYADDRNITQSALRSPIYFFHYYPTRRHARVGDFGRWFQDQLLTAKATADGYGVPLWLMLPHFSNPVFRFPTPAETRCMVYQSIASGCRGIFYFRGNTSASASGIIQTGLINSTGEIGDSIYRDLNESIAHIEPLLLDWVQEDLGTAVDQPNVAQAFKDSDGNRYLVVVNSDCVLAGTIEVVIYATGFGSAEDVLTGEEMPLTAGDQRTTLKMRMEAGEGRILKLLPTPSTSIPVKFTTSIVPPTVVSPALSILIGRPMSRIDVSGTHATVVETTDPMGGKVGAWLLDITNPTRPEIGAQLLGCQAGKSIYDGDRMLLSDLGRGLIVFDVADVSSPKEISGYTGITGNVSDIESMDGGRYSVGAQRAGVHILEVTGEAEPKLLAHIDTPGRADEICLVQNVILFVFGRTEESAAFDITAFEEPNLLCTYPTITNVEDSLVYENTVYVAARGNGLFVIDASVFPPVITQRIQTVEAVSLALLGKTLFLADRAGGLVMFDIFDPNHLVMRKRITHEKGGIVSAVAVLEEHILIGSEAGGVHIVPLTKINTDTSLLVY